MNRQLVRLGAVLFLIGAGLGLLFRQAVRATPADDPYPSPVWPKAVYYTEKWQADEGCMNTPSGYRPVHNFGGNTPVSGRIDSAGTYVETSPDLFVTKWRVQGHIHFQ